MHVHPRTSLETLPPAIALPVATKKGAGSHAQNADGTSTAQPTVTGLYAQALKRKSATTTDDDSSPGYSSSLSSEDDSSVTTGDQAGSTADASADLGASIPQTYTARGALSGPRPLPRNFPDDGLTSSDSGPNRIISS